MAMPLERITILCFGASYSVALALEIVQLIWPRPVQRLLSLSFGTAGLVAQTLFLAFHPPVPSSQLGSLLLLAWILAVFYLYGSIHHRRLVWGVFVLPLVLALTVLAGLDAPAPAPTSAWWGAIESLRGSRFWQLAHYGLLLMAAVGVSVGFIASLMYLIQAYRLKAKIPPGHGVRLLSLERLEEMNRRAINLAFPLLTAGVLVGVILMVRHGADSLPDRLDPKILGTILLWLVFALLVYLRYGFHLRGRRLAVLTMLAFGLLLLTLVSSHTSVQGGGP
jgi:ABC-type transport system involved in cytochrome c biogenesis permease subunit